MFRIGADYVATQGKDKTKPGAIYLFIVRYENGSRKTTERRICIVENVFEDALETMNDEIIKRIRQAYLIIEQRIESSRRFVIDDVCADFRRIIKGDKPVNDIVAKSENDFPLRKDLVSVMRRNRKDFQFANPADESARRANGLIEYMRLKSSELKRAGRLSTANSYLATSNTLAEFCNSDILPFENVNEVLIKNYDAWLTQSGIKDSTHAFYLRTLRTALRHAEKDNGMMFSPDWFRGLNTTADVLKKKDEKVTSIDIKKLLIIAKLIISDDENLQLARDMFLFAFYCRGMELVDVANLKKTNIRKDFLEYRKRGKGKEVRIPISNNAWSIIGKYSTTSDTYIFPLKERYAGMLNTSMRNMITKKMNELGKKVGIDNLSLTMNIASWQRFVAENDLLATAGL